MYMLYVLCLCKLSALRYLNLHKPLYLSHTSHLCLSHVSWVLHLFCLLSALTISYVITVSNSNECANKNFHRPLSCGNRESHSEMPIISIIINHAVIYFTVAYPFLSSEMYYSSMQYVQGNIRNKFLTIYRGGCFNAVPAFTSKTGRLVLPQRF